MQKKFKIKNIILKSITWVAAIAFLLAAMAYDDAETIVVHACVMFVCIAWFWLYLIANNFFWGCE